jgi:hypothetical protein
MVPKGDFIEKKGFHISSLAILLFLSRGAVATAEDQTDPALKRQAQEYFYRAEALVKKGEFTKAAAAFLRAYETLPHRATLLNVATCYDRAGQIPEAVESYYRFLEIGADSEDAPRVIQRLSELEFEVGQVHVKCPVASCAIEIDDVNRGEAPLWAVLEPGVHSVEAFSEGVVFNETSVQIQPNKTVVVEMRRVDTAGTPAGPRDTGETVGPAQSPAPELPAPMPRTPSGDGPRLGSPFWIFAGSTVVAGGVAAVLGGVASKRHAEFEDSGRTDEELRDEGQTAQTSLNVMLVVTSMLGATALGIGIYDMWFSQGSTSAESDRKVAVVPGPGAGLAVRGAF